MDLAGIKLTLTFSCQDMAIQTPCLVAVAVTEGASLSVALVMR